MRDGDAIPHSWEHGYVEANGIELHYARTGGPGPALVVSHGVTDDGYCRTHLARALEDDFDVVLYDARGHGRSDAPASGYGPDERAADLAGLVEALGVDDPILYGHSMGGDTVAAAGANYPDLPRAVVLEDPAGMIARGGEDGGDGDGEADDGPGENIAERIEWWGEHTREELMREDDWISELASGEHPGLASRLADARLRLSPTIEQVFEEGLAEPGDVYGGIEAPTLILKADADEEGRARNRDLADELPDGRLVHVDGAGHGVVWDEREAATAQLREFLDGV